MRRKISIIDQNRRFISFCDWGFSFFLICLLFFILDLCCCVIGYFVGIHVGSEVLRLLFFPLVFNGDDHIVWCVHDWKDSPVQPPLSQINEKEIKIPLCGEV